MSMTWRAWWWRRSNFSEWPLRHRAETLLARLRGLDLDGTSPREALTLLGELQQEAASDDPVAR